MASGDERFYSQALTLSTDASPATRALAASVLACVGNPSAGGDLVALLGDPSDDVVLAAALCTLRSSRTGPERPVSNRYWTTSHGKCASRLGSRCLPWVRPARSCCG